MTLCPSCGKMNSDEARFCFNCGAILAQGPPVKVEVKSPLTSIPKVPNLGATNPSSPIYGTRQLPRLGACFYHADLPSSFVCSRCGRAVCVNCTRQYGMLSFCSECYWGLAPKLSHPTEQYPAGYQQHDFGRSFF